MLDKPFTKEDYTKRINELKTLFIDLKEENLSPSNIKSKICQVQRNNNRIIELAIEALDNKVLAVRMHRAAKTMRDLAYSEAMLSDEIKKLGSAELRKSKSLIASKEDIKNVDATAYNKDQADSYFDSVKMMYDDLGMAYNTLREQTKLFQSTLYLEATKST